MGTFTRIPKSTFDNLQLDAGVILTSFDPSDVVAPSDDDILCATTGGITASCIPTYSDFGEDIDNCPTNCKELKHLDSWECKLSFTSLGSDVDSIRMALGSADVSGSSVTPRRDLDQDDFTTSLWWVGDRADGGCVAIEVKHALSTGGFSLQTTKSGKGQVSCEITGHVSIEEQDVVPMVFYSLGGDVSSGDDTTEDTDTEDTETEGTDTNTDTEADTETGTEDTDTETDTETDTDTEDSETEPDTEEETEEDTETEGTGYAIAVYEGGEQVTADLTFLSVSPVTDNLVIEIVSEASEGDTVLGVYYVAADTSLDVNPDYYVYNLDGQKVACSNTVVLDFQDTMGLADSVVTDEAGNQLDLIGYIIEED